MRIEKSIFIKLYKLQYDWLSQDLKLIGQLVVRYEKWPVNNFEAVWKVLDNFERVNFSFCLLTFISALDIKDIIFNKSGAWYFKCAQNSMESATNQKCTFYFQVI